MRKIFVLTIIVGLLVGGVFAVSAQDDMMDKVVCDSDLILNLYIAEYYFGFGSVMNMLMMGESDDMMMGLDLSVYEKGQYAPLFDSMMMMSDDMMMNSMMSQEQMTAVIDYMTMDMGDMMEDEMMGDMTTLEPAIFEGEPAECTALRSELNHFYTALVNSSMMMSEG